MNRAISAMCAIWAVLLFGGTRAALPADSTSTGAAPLSLHLGKVRLETLINELWMRGYRVCWEVMPLPPGTRLVRDEQTGRTVYDVPKREINLAVESRDAMLREVVQVFSDYVLETHRGVDGFFPKHDSVLSWEEIVAASAEGNEARDLLAKVFERHNIHFDWRHWGNPGSALIPKLTPGTYRGKELLMTLCEHNADVVWTLAGAKGHRVVSFQSINEAVSYGHFVRPQERAWKARQAIATGAKPSGSRVTLFDTNLETKVRDAIGKTEGYLFESDIAAISDFDGIAGKISDLRGLDRCANLIRLDLRQNSIEDLGPLSSLTGLLTLHLGGNMIRDVSPLRDLQELFVLDLSENKVVDITPLSGLTDLIELDLSSNSVSEISALSRMKKLKGLRLEDNSITDLSALSALSDLTELYLGENSVSDVSVLSEMRQLKKLRLRSNEVRDISPLSSLAELSYVSLDDNVIRDISALQNLASLETIWLQRNPIEDISPLSGLHKLRELYLDTNRISDLSPLVENCNAGGLGQGDEVHLGKNPLNDQAVDVHIPYLRSKGVAVSYVQTDGQTVWEGFGEEWKTIAEEDAQPDEIGENEEKAPSSQERERRVVTIAQPAAASRKARSRGTSSGWLLAGGALAIGALASLGLAIRLLRKDRSNRL